MSLATRLGALVLDVRDAVVEVSEVDLPGFRGRPTSVLRVRGDGVGVGEHVGWTRDVHEAFARCIAQLKWQRGTISELASRPELAHGVSAEEARYRRAALEGALLDLAQLPRGATTKLKYVISFAAMREPAAQVCAILAHNPSARFKIDVDPAWTANEAADLAALDCVEILDGKGRGERVLWKMIREHFPTTLLEDAPLDTPGPLALDQSLLTLDDVRRAVERGFAINVKAPRLGGFLAAMRALEVAPRAYMGGMFEVGPGRTLSRRLAAQFCALAPNDLAQLHADPARNTLADLSADPFAD